MSTISRASMLVARTRPHTKLDDPIETDLFAHHIRPGRMGNRLAVVILPNIEMRVEVHDHQVRVPL